VAGRILASECGATVRLLLLRDRPEGDPLVQSAADAGVRTDLVGQCADLPDVLAASHLVLDALFGIGARLPLDDETRRVLSAVQAARQVVLASARPYAVTDALPVIGQAPLVLAVDCPSGLDCDSGALDSATLPADETITMIAVKPGLLQFPGAAAVGRLSVADLGVPAVIGLRDTGDPHLFTADDAAALLPARPANSHKGTFGRVLVAGGSANYPGAPMLAAQAAYRAGAGLVTVGVPGPLVEWLAGAHPECTWLHLPHELGALTADAATVLAEQFAAMSVLVLGMGLGRAPETVAFLERLLDGPEPNARPALGFATALARQPAAASASLPPLVLDADGLSLLAGIPDWPKRLPPDSILTPHPGEMARLCRMSTADVNVDRWTLAREWAVKWQVVLVLKGAHTVIADPEGRQRVLPFKTPALATAGTGDVLAGLIGALRAQGLQSFDAAAVAATIHGLAGLRAAETAGTTRGIVASDIVAALPAVFAALRR
jgi:NAD(P)H-hydrate epimerase